MSSLVLKLIVIITMVIDHTGAIFFDNNDIMRFIGRIAFILCGFMLLQGYKNTKNDKKRIIKYMFRLLLFACISEPIYDLLFYKTIFYLYDQNVLFTYLLSIICFILYDKFGNAIIDKLFMIFIAFYISCMGQILFVNYGAYGILLFFAFHLIDRLNIKNKYKYLSYLLLVIIYILLNYLTFGFKISSLGYILALIPIILYNGKRGYNSKITKYLFYIFYPVHLLILLLLSYIIVI